MHQEPTAGWEIFGRRAIRKGSWKAAWLAPPLGKGDWALYNLDEDPGELTDLAGERPEVLADLLDAWDDYVEENGVIVVEEDRAFGPPVPLR